LPRHQYSWSVSYARLVSRSRESPRGGRAGDFVSAAPRIGDTPSYQSTPRWKVPAPLLTALVTVPLLTELMKETPLKRLQETAPHQPALCIRNQCHTDCPYHEYRRYESSCSRRAVAWFSTTARRISPPSAKPKPFSPPFRAPSYSPEKTPAPPVAGTLRVAKPRTRVAKDRRGVVQSRSPAEFAL